MPGIPNIQTARLRALRGSEDPSLTVRLQQAQRTQAATPPSPPPAPSSPARETAPAPRTPVTLSAPVTQPITTEQKPQNPVITQAMQFGVMNTIRSKARELALLNAERDYEQGL